MVRIVGRLWVALHRIDRRFAEAAYNFSFKIFSACCARNTVIFFRNSGREFARIAIASSAAFLAPAVPIASVPTGIPAGICTVESSESIPLRIQWTSDLMLWTGGSISFKKNGPGHWIFESGSPC